MLSVIPAVTSWVTIALAPNFATILAARFVGAFSPALVMAAAGVYISEIVHPHYRGSFSALNSFFLTVGFLIIYGLGYVANYRVICWVSLAFPAATLMLMYFQPDTPYWLVERGRTTDARSDSSVSFDKLFFISFCLRRCALQHFRGKHYDITEELLEMTSRSTTTRSQSSPRKNGSAGGGENGSVSNITHEHHIHHPSAWTLLRSRTFLVPYFAMAGLFSLIQYIGMTAMTTYMVVIFREAGGPAGEVVDPDLAPAIVGVVRLVAVAIGAVAMGRFRRRTMYLASSAAFTVLVFGFALVCYLIKEQGLGSDGNVAWLPLVFACGFSTIFSMGMLPVVQVVVTEVYPTCIRSLGSSLTFSAVFANIAIVVKSFPAQVWY